MPRIYLYIVLYVFDINFKHIKQTRHHVQLYDKMTVTNNFNHKTLTLKPKP
jgi:hypothetical protein